ncbi:DUF488 domain-containing protein [Lysobacter sp. H21R4]|uniref:DUF488 domain-containing protein n=1 Tax=Lysobacter sp. H21R4 TaxID=2781021 RepID=UPI001887CC7C|nr:DUF488 domain-containing protein [Lysobacter sp. H21R4]QOY63756.1 DUF488 domain-containing protein [Lysobacter sp. H21R4]
MPSPTGTLWTIGHSTREWPVFVGMLKDAGITALVDVRRFPGSRRNPQFSAEAMAREMPATGIRFIPMVDLGGRRKVDPNTRNTAWRNDSFRGYADYMETAAFQAARDRLAELALQERVAIMCAEAVWWQCHRGLISDDFKARGWEVIHLMAPGRSDEHPYTSAARIVDGKLDYSAPEPPQASLF